MTEISNCTDGSFKARSCNMQLRMYWSKNDEVLYVRNKNSYVLDLHWKLIGLGSCPVANLVINSV
jgi:hypothetical protein